MNTEKTGKPLAITGAILLLNGFVFLFITLSLSSGLLMGVAIGCLGSGIPLLIIGFLQNKKLKQKSGQP